MRASEHDTSIRRYPKLPLLWMQYSLITGVGRGDGHNHGKESHCAVIKHKKLLSHFAEGKENTYSSPQTELGNKTEEAPSTKTPSRQPPTIRSPHAYSTTPQCNPMLLSICPKSTLCPSHASGQPKVNLATTTCTHKIYFGFHVNHLHRRKRRQSTQKSYRSTSSCVHSTTSCYAKLFQNSMPPIPPIGSKSSANGS